MGIEKKDPMAVLDIGFDEVNKQAGFAHTRTAENIVRIPMKPAGDSDLKAATIPI